MGYCKQEELIYDGIVGADVPANHPKEVQMIAMTWVEVLLTGLFAASFAFSIGFCISNYAKVDEESIRFKETVK